MRNGSCHLGFREVPQSAISLHAGDVGKRVGKFQSQSAGLRSREADGVNVSPPAGADAVFQLSRRQEKRSKLLLPHLSFYPGPAW